MEIAPALRNIGIGLAAGLIGTLVMTVSQKAEMAVTERPESMAPVEAAEKVTGVIVTSAAGERNVSLAVHLAYGTALGAGLAALDGVPEPVRTIAAIVGAQAIGMATLQGLNLEGKPSEWDATDAAIDVGHHVVYAVVAAFAYRAARDMLTGR